MQSVEPIAGLIWIGATRLWSTHSHQTSLKHLNLLIVSIITII